MKKVNTYVGIFGLLSVVVFSGCSTKDQEIMYYNAIQQQNENYMKSYDTVENESIQFDGTFEGKISIIKPKKLPQLAKIQKPKSSADTALDWARVVVPSVTAVAGMHYGFKAIESSNDASSRQIEAYTGNFDKTSVSTSVTDITNTSVSDSSTSVTDTSVSDTSVSDTSLTDTSTIDTSTTTTDTAPDFTTDGTTTTVTQ
mgnify:CR=1 FL=1